MLTLTASGMQPAPHSADWQEKGTSEPETLAKYTDRDAGVAVLKLVLVDHGGRVGLHVAGDVAGVGHPAVGGGVAGAVAGEVADAVPDPQHLGDEDQHEGQGQDDGGVEDGEFDDGLTLGPLPHGRGSDRSRAR